ncbi:hypothetical protein SNK04_006961 [Fusarium graminearum]
MSHPSLVRHWRPSGAFLTASYDIQRGQESAQEGYQVSQRGMRDCIVSSSFSSGSGDSDSVDKARWEGGRGDGGVGPGLIHYGLPITLEERQARKHCQQH